MNKKLYILLGVLAVLLVITLVLIFSPKASEPPLTIEPTVGIIQVDASPEPDTATLAPDTTAIDTTGGTGNADGTTSTGDTTGAANPADPLAGLTDEEIAALAMQEEDHGSEGDGNPVD